MRRDPPVTLSRKQALAQVDEAQKLFNSVRPIKYEFVPCPPNTKKGGIIFVSNMIMVAAGLNIGLANLFMSVPFLYLLSGIVMTTSISSLVALLAVESPKHRGYPKQRIRKILSYVFLDKSQRALIEKYQKSLAPYEQAMEVYQLLVSRGVKELEDKGVFEVINDPNNSDNDKFVSVNEKTGEIEYIDRSVYEDDRRKELVTNPELVSKVILGKLADKKELFG